MVESLVQAVHLSWCLKMAQHPHATCVNCHSICHSLVEGLRIFSSLKVLKTTRRRSMQGTTLNDFIEIYRIRSISRCSRLLAAANIRVMCAHVNKPHELRHEGHSTCEVIGRRKQGNRLEVPCRYRFAGKRWPIKKLEILFQNQVTAPCLNSSLIL